MAAADLDGQCALAAARPAEQQRQRAGRHAGGVYGRTPRPVASQAGRRTQRSPVSIPALTRNGEAASHECGRVRSPGPACDNQTLEARAVRGDAAGFLSSNSMEEPWL